MRPGQSSTLEKTKKYKKVMFPGYTGSGWYYDDDIEDPDVKERTKLRFFKE